MHHVWLIFGMPHNGNNYHGVFDSPDRVDAFLDGVTVAADACAETDYAIYYTQQDFDAAMAANEIEPMAWLKEQVDCVDESLADMEDE